jgi:hypothetical protein
MLLSTCSTIAASLATAIVLANWHVAIETLRWSRAGKLTSTSQVLLAPELLLWVAAMLWHVANPHSSFGWVALALVGADLASWAVAHWARSRASGGNHAL